MSVTPVRTRVAAAVLLASAVAVAGALWFQSLGSGSAEPENRAGEIATHIIETAPDGDEIVTGLADVSPAQAAALADGYVTRAEYENAIWATFECIQAAGYEPSEPPHPDASGARLRYSFLSGGDPNQTAVSLECQRRHSLLVDISIAVQEAPTEAQLAAARQALDACLVQAGIPAELVAETEPRHELTGYGSGNEYRDCSRQVSKEFEIPYFGG